MHKTVNKNFPKICHMGFDVWAEERDVKKQNMNACQNGIE